MQQVESFLIWFATSVAFGAVILGCIAALAFYLFVKSFV